MRWLLLVTTVLLACSAPAERVAPSLRSAEPAAASVLPDSSTQLLTVVTSSWRATEGELRRWERAVGGVWRPVGEATPVVVGRSGLGWGIGLHGDGAPRGGLTTGEPRKAEGDGRAPAGAFRLDRAFGYADREPTGLDYLTATPTTVCIDDVGSPRYNAVFDAGAAPATLGLSLERMRRDDALYRIGVVVDHNGGGRGGAPRAGAGSCIFLHVWRGPGTSTAGCTALPDAALAEALAWLDAPARPALVQLPAPAYDRLAAAWALPPR